jgi:hypothetical protein
MREWRCRGAGVGDVLGARIMQSGGGAASIIVSRARTRTSRPEQQGILGRVQRARKWQRKGSGSEAVRP